MAMKGKHITPKKDSGSHLGQSPLLPKRRLIWLPSFPDLTMKVKASGPAGPWIKQKDVMPFSMKSNTYFSITANPGQVIRRGDEYVQFFSATPRKPGNPCVRRT